MTDETSHLPQYQVAHVQRVLAEDERTAELGIHVRVQGDVIQVSGDVEGAQRRDEIDAVLHELAPDMRIRNDIRVTEVGEPVGSEELR